MTYTMTCSCGDVMNFEGNTRDEAVVSAKAMMTQEMLDKHWAEKHATDQMPKPTVEETHLMLEQKMMPMQ